MRITTESTFHITEQPKAFCPMIDGFIEKIKDAKEEAEANLDVLRQNLEIDDEVLNLKPFSLPNQPFDKIEQESDALLSWSNGWLELFKQSVEKETDPNIVEQLNDVVENAENAILNFKSLFSDFKNAFEPAFDQLLNHEHFHEKIVDDYNYGVSDALRVDQETYETVNKQFELLEPLFKNIEKEVEDIFKSFEIIREAASDLRLFVNEKLKVHTKVQLTRINDEVWFGYMDWHMGANEKQRYLDLVQDTTELGFRII